MGMLVFVYNKDNVTRILSGLLAGLVSALFSRGLLVLTRCISPPLPGWQDWPPAGQFSAVFLAVLPAVCFWL